MPSKVLPKLVRSTASLSGKTAWNKSLTERRCRFGVVRTPSNHQEALKKTSMSICLIQRSQIHQIRTVSLKQRCWSTVNCLIKPCLTSYCAKPSEATKPIPVIHRNMAGGQGILSVGKKNGCKGGCWVRPSQKPQRFCKSQVSAASWNQGIFIYIYIYIYMYICVWFSTHFKAVSTRINDYEIEWMQTIPNHRNSDHVSLRYPA